jgi:hypothetical protein
MRRAAVGIALAVIAAPAWAMPVSTFLSQFESLDPNGASAQLTQDLGELRAELQKDASELRAERLAAVSAGRKPAYCPGLAGARPGANEIIAALEEIPEANRPYVEVKDALRSYLSARFPC